MHLDSIEKIRKMKWRELLNIECDVCHKHYTRPRNHFPETNIDPFVPQRHKCSKECIRISRSKYSDEERIFTCGHCGGQVIKRPHELRKSKSGLMFCNSSCSAKYSNAHKTVGTRVSKLECWLAEKLVKLYPEVEFHFNRKDAIESELDIYIPSLKLAFELNGIFHYEPIYGDEKLERTKNNDGRKFAACAERGISLCVIDTSKQVYFKESTSQLYLDIIAKIINQKVTALTTT